MHVTQVDPCSHLPWQEFVASRPDALIYHDWRWLAALAAGYGHQPLGLLCSTDSGQVAGVLPLIPARGIVSGRRLVSLPHTPFCGPLTDDRGAAGAMLREAVRVAGELSADLQIRTTAGDLPADVPGLERTTWAETYVRELPRPGEQLRFGNSRNHSRIRWAVNRATKGGVRVRQAQSERDLRGWYRLYLETMRSHAFPPRPYRFFGGLWELLRPPGLMKLLIAERREAGRLRPIAGSILLLGGRTAIYAFNGRSRADLALRPNDLIQWHGLHAAADEGYRWYDFGQVEEGQRGLADFKAKWSAEARQVYRYLLAPQHDLQARARDADGRARHAIERIWRRLPLRLTAYTGTVFYRYL